MVDFEAFHACLPAQFVQLLEIFQEAGFKAGVVGGIPRDFLNEMRVGDDFDVELRPVSEDSYLKRFDALAETLAAKGFKAREKGLKVFEVNFKGGSLEYTLPRIEKFNGEVHHRNFEAQHIADMDYTRGFKRRDFTVNAVMFEHADGKWCLVDPLGGVSDIKARTLKACDNQSFVKDPVRFLRALRFSIKLGFQMDISLLTMVKNMELTVSQHYLKSEATKSEKPLMFLLECFKLRPGHFPFGALEKYECTILEYEKRFKAYELKAQVGEALFLPLKTRKDVFEKLGLSSKGLIELDLKEVNLGTIKSSSPAELSRRSWAGAFCDFLTKARELDDKKLDWLLKEEGCEFDASFVRRFAQLKVEPDKSISGRLKKFDALKKKVHLLL